MQVEEYVSSWNRVGVVCSIVPVGRFYRENLYTMVVCDAYLTQDPKLIQFFP